MRWKEKRDMGCKIEESEKIKGKLRALWRKHYPFLLTLSLVRPHELTLAMGWKGGKKE